MSTNIREKIKVRKLFCFFEKYRKFQQLFSNTSGAFSAMPVRFRSPPSHCGLSPQPCQFDSASLHLTAGFRPIQEERESCICASTNSSPSLPVHGSMLIACFRQIWECHQIRLEGLHLSEYSLSSRHYCISRMQPYQNIRFL